MQLRNCGTRVCNNVNREEQCSLILGAPLACLNDRKLKLFGMLHQCNDENENLGNLVLLDKAMPWIKSNTKGTE